MITTITRKVFSLFTRNHGFKVYLKNMNDNNDNGDDEHDNNNKGNNDNNNNNDINSRTYLSDFLYIIFPSVAVVPTTFIPLKT